MLIIENTVINMLYKITHPVSDILTYLASGLEHVKEYSFKNAHNKNEINFILLSPNGMIEYSTKQQIADVIKNTNTDDLNVNNILLTLVAKKLRIVTKPGRLITKLNLSIPNTNENDIAKFGELFTEKIQMFSSDTSTIEIISGEKIAWAYHYENYTYNSGELATSCMRYDRCSEYFSLYTENPQLVKMVVNIIDGKVAARCLLWDNKYYDRIYFANYNIYLAMQSFCETAGYERIYFKDDIIRKNISIQLPKSYSYYSPYPYMDTFKFININDSTLNTNCKDCYYILNDTEGDYNTFNVCDECGVADASASLNYYSSTGLFYCDNHCPIYES